MSLSRTARVLFPLAAVAAIAATSHSPVFGAIGAATDPYCWHDKWVISSEWHCGDTTSSSYATSVSFASNSANEDTLMIVRTNGETVKVPIRLGTDAVFMSRFAVEQFLIPYLATNGGRGDTARVADLMKRNWADRADPMFLYCGRTPAGPVKWYCADGPPRRIDPTTIRRIAYIRVEGGRRELQPGRGADAIFLSKDATERNLLPYYQRKVTKLQGVISRWPRPQR